MITPGLMIFVGTLMRAYAMLQLKKMQFCGEKDDVKPIEFKSLKRHQEATERIRKRVKETGR